MISLGMYQCSVLEVTIVTFAKVKKYEFASDITRDISFKNINKYNLVFLILYHIPLREVKRMWK